MILIAGGLPPRLEGDQGNPSQHRSGRAGRPEADAKVTLGFGAAIFQIILLDIVFSVDSIITAVGMTEHLPVMVIAVLVAVATMMLAANPLANFIERNPTIVMLALASC